MNVGKPTVVVTTDPLVVLPKTPIPEPVKEPAPPAKVPEKVPA